MIKTRKLTIFNKRCIYVLICGILIPGIITGIIPNFNLSKFPHPLIIVQIITYLCVIIVEIVLYIIVMLLNDVFDYDDVSPSNELYFGKELRIIEERRKKKTKNENAPIVEKL